MSNHIIKPQTTEELERAFGIVHRPVDTSGLEFECEDAYNELKHQFMVLRAYITHSAFDATHYGAGTCSFPDERPGSMLEAFPPGALKNYQKARRKRLIEKNQEKEYHITPMYEDGILDGGFCSSFATAYFRGDVAYVLDILYHTKSYWGTKPGFDPEVWGGRDTNPYAAAERYRRFKLCRKWTEMAEAGVPDNLIEEAIFTNHKEDFCPSWWV
jgi:hypothetical protein